jgi:hypothetical protein
MGIVVVGVDIPDQDVDNFPTRNPSLDIYEEITNIIKRREIQSFMHDLYNDSTVSYNFTSVAYNVSKPIPIPKPK